jgi:hypothetical protein
MVARLLEGFDTYSALVDGLTNWDSVTSGQSLTTGRYGGKALSATNVSDLLIKGFTGLDTWIVGCNMMTTGTGSPVFIRFYENTTLHIDILHNITTGKFDIRLNSSVITSSTNSFAFDTWHHVQVKVYCNNSGTINLRVDGSNEITFSGDTQNGQTGLINSIRMGPGGGSGTSCYLDDIFIFDTTGSTCNDIITNGEPRVESLPIVSEDSTNFTPSTGADNAAMINEIPQDGDTTYNESSTLNDIDLFTVQDLSSPIGTIYTVQPKIYARKTITGLRKLSPAIYSGSTTYIRGAGVSVNNTYSWVTSLEDVDPDTSAAWTVTGVNNMKSGYKITT